MYDASLRGIGCRGAVLHKRVRAAPRILRRFPGYSKRGDDGPKDDIAEVVFCLYDKGLLDEIGLKNFGYERDGSITAAQVWKNPDLKSEISDLVYTQKKKLVLLDDFGMMLGLHASMRRSAVSRTSASDTSPCRTSVARPTAS